MGRLTGPQTLRELIFAKLPEGLIVEQEYQPYVLSTKYTWTRESDGKKAVLDIGDEEFVRMDYPDLLAQAIVEEVLKQFDTAEVPEVNAGQR